MMQKFAQRQARKGTAAGDEARQAPVPVDEKQLSEDVECCLAEIDQALKDTVSERDRAGQEFTAIRGAWTDSDEDHRALRLWQARYAHLGLESGVSCCVPYAYDKSSDAYL